MAGQTQIPFGHAMAKKVYGAAVFATMQRRPSLRKNLSGPAPKQGSAEAKLKGQSSADYPIVQVRDLNKSAGDTVTVDLFDEVAGKPIMGDKTIAGKMMSLSSSTMQIVINQYRAGVGPGGRMTQKRTVHNLRGIGRAALGGYFARMEDQLCLVHLAGARGDDNGRDWVVPLDTDPDFSEIVVNTVKAPTPNRRFFAGSATSVANLATTDSLRLSDIDSLRLYLDEVENPLQPIRLPGDPQSDENPLFCLNVTARQWNQLLTNTTGTSWRTFLANAHERSKGFNHPLFMGQTGMWNGIVIKKMARAIRFGAGSTVMEANNAGVETPVVANVATDRAILLGAQALAECYGAHHGSGYYYDWSEEQVDHGNAVEMVAAGMGGKAKVRFEIDGVQTDHGVITLDTYAP